MLSNYYPVPAASKSQQATLWQQLSRRVQLFTQPASKPTTTNSDYLVEINQWQDTFNHLLSNRWAELTSRSAAIEVKQHGNLGKLKRYGELGLITNGNIQACLYYQHWQQITHLPQRPHIHLSCFDDSAQSSWLLNSQTAANADLAPLNYQNSEQLIAKPKQANQQIAEHELMQMWASLSHVHQFYDMLSLFNLNLLDSIHLMQGRWTTALSIQQLEKLLQQCSNEHLNTKILTGNRGILHTLKSPIESLTWQDKHIALQGQHYQCLLNLAAAKEVWLVKRATKHGIHHSIESFDEHGRLIMQLQENTPQQQAESALWQRCLGKVCIIP